MFKQNISDKHNLYIFEILLISAIQMRMADTHQDLQWGLEVFDQLVSGGRVGHAPSLEYGIFRWAYKKSVF